MKQDVLWSLTVRRDCTLLDRIEAAAAAGYGALSLSAADFSAVGHDVERARTMRKIADDRGVVLKIMDGTSAWYPFDASRSTRMNPTTSEIGLAAAEAFGCSNLCAVPALPSDMDADGFAEHFAKLCDTARERGMTVQLEFTPLPPVCGLKMGWDIVRLADRANGGIVFDTWHFFRSDAAFDVLETIPGRRITGVQLSDGAKDLIESPMRDMLYHRLLPGEGVFDLERVVKTLDGIGGLNDVGPEILSREQHDLSPPAAAQRAADAIDKLMVRALAR